MIKKIEDFIHKMNKVYPWTIFISIGLIMFSLVPYGWKIWDNILVSIGCSGIAAALMAIFIDINSEHKEAKRKEELRSLFLSGLNCEFKRLFERLLWFDKHLEEVNLTHDLKYYLSLDFFRDVHFKEPKEQPRHTTLKECANEIEQICKKYEIEELRQLDAEINNKIQKMFLIIGNASMPLLTELERIRKNEMYLISSNIFTAEEITNLCIFIGKHVELLKTPNTNYGVALHSLLDGYKFVYAEGHYDNDIMVITWQNSKDIVDLLIEKRHQEASVKVTKPVQVTPKAKRKQKRKRKK